MWDDNRFLVEKDYVEPSDEVPAGWDWVDNSATPQNGPQTITKGVLDNATDTSGPDSWGGFWKGLIGKGVDYAIKKDAVTSGVVPRGMAASGQPVYMGAPYQAQSGLNLGGNTLLLLAIGAAVVFALKD